MVERFVTLKPAEISENDGNINLIEENNVWNSNKMLIQK